MVGDMRVSASTPRYVAMTGTGSLASRRACHFRR
jgi:hypothetical protein